MSAPIHNRAEAILGELEDRIGRPLRAMLEVSDRCNEVCVHCYQVQGQKGEMSTEQVKALMDELAEMGILMLTISGGEATLRHDFLELIAYARSKMFAVRLYTNGLTMTAQLAAEMKRLAVQSIDISLYSHRADVHELVTGVPGSFERTVAGIRRLIAEGVDVHVKTPVMSVNQDELHAYADFVRGLGATLGLDPGVLTAREGNDRSPISLSRSDETYSRLLTDPRLGGVARTGGTARAPRPLDDLLCGAGASVHVEPNGELRPCTSLELPLGNVSDGVAHARDTNGTLRGLRALRWHNAHGCRDCDLRAYCGRCYAGALADVGDALAPYASACASARTAYAVVLGAQPEIAPRSAAVADESAFADETAVEVGPYRHVEGHRFQAIADVITDEDDALAARLGWVRRASAPLAHKAKAGELVQLRRPGRTRPVVIPAALKSAAAAVTPAALKSAAASNDAIDNIA